MVYQLSGNPQYAERLWAELEAAAGFPDWNPVSFLSTAEMTHAFAIGYDWLYDYWSVSRREVLRDAIIDLGLTPGLQGYRNGEWWATTTNNWNIVTNGGLGMGALAVGEHVQEMADEILHTGIQNLPIAIAEYAPDGAYPEGVGYWAFATRYLAPYVAALQTAVGSDFGLMDFPGLSQTGHFPIYMSGPFGQTFNFYDSSGSTQRPPEMFWLASTFGEPVYTWWSAQANATARHLLWYDPAFNLNPVEAEFPLDYYFRGSEVVSGRSAWMDPNAVFVGFKGGDNQHNHGDLDLGTFVLDALGTRWAIELGPESYDMPGYWSDGPNGQRWTYYRKRGEGQNTLVVNPGLAPDQDPLATGEIVRFESGPGEMFAIADLSEAYASHGVTSWQRGVSMYDHRRQVLVQDELIASQPVEAWWFMHTRASIEVSADGQTAILRDGSQRLQARILAPASGVRFVAMDAEPHWLSPNPSEQTANPDVRKLAIEVNGTDNLQLAVLFTPLLPHQEPDQSVQAVVPLAAWDIAHPELPMLSGITVDGLPLEGFTPDVFTYYLAADPQQTQAPVISAAAVDPGAQVVVTAAAELPGTTVIEVILAGSPTVRYEVHHLKQTSDERVTASIVGTFPPSYTIDNNFGTFFSAEGHGQWVQYDLGVTHDVYGVSLAWYQGNVRAFAFEVLVSEDADNWTLAYSGMSSGTTLNLEPHLFSETAARYVRIVGYGNTVNQWMSIIEARIIHTGGVWPELPELVPYLTDLQLTAPSDRITVGGTMQLVLTGTMSDESAADFGQAQVRYYSTNESVAAVSSSGAVEALQEGTVRLTAVVRMNNGYHLRYDSIVIAVDDPSRVTVQPAADAHIRAGDYANDNYGNATSLTIKQDNNPSFHREGLMAFDLSALEGDIESAVLYVYAQVNTGGAEITQDHGLDVYAADGSWTESAVTWNTRPAVGSQLGSAQVDRFGAWRSIDITDHVLDRLALDGQINLAFRQNPPPGNVYAMTIRSKEFATAEFRPYLEIRLAQP